jgi:hypothetical protein
MVKAADIGSLIVLTPDVPGGQAEDFRYGGYCSADRRLV